MKMAKSAKFVVVLLFCCSFNVFAEDPQCDGTWNLDFELDDKEDEFVIPDAVILLTEKTFENSSIEIKNCEDDGTYEYFLDEQFIWDLRFHLYNDTYNAMQGCRDCENVLATFRSCMLGIRNEMTETLNGWKATIQAHLTEIKTEAERDCDV